MKYEWFVSLRYLRAKRKQTFISVISFISIAGVMLGVAALILVLAIMTGFHDGVRQQILGNIPHVLIQRHGDEISDYAALAEEAKDVLPHVTDVSPFISKEAMLLAGGNVAPISLKGIPKDNKIFKQEFQTLDGVPVDTLVFDDDVVTPGIVIGLDTATTLGVSVGDKVNVIPPLFNITPFGMIPKMKPFRVVAIQRNKSSFLDTYYAYISLTHAQHFLGLENRVTGIEVEVDSYDQAASVAFQLRNLLDYPYLVRSWEDLFGSFLSALRLEKLGLFIVLGIIVLVAAFNIATTLIMVVMEKHKDIAILRSMGATAQSIMKIFILEGFVIGFLGTFGGTLLGLFLAQNADSIIKSLERTLQVKIFDKSVYGMDTFPSVVNPEDVIAVVAVAMTICLFATVYPAWRASRMDPAEALRYE